MRIYGGKAAVYMDGVFLCGATALVYYSEGWHDVVATDDACAWAWGHWRQRVCKRRNGRMLRAFRKVDRQRQDRHDWAMRQVRSGQ